MGRKPTIRQFAGRGSSWETWRVLAGITVALLAYGAVILAERSPFSPAEVAALAAHDATATADTPGECAFATTVDGGVSLSARSARCEAGSTASTKPQ
jgi:hypothetical protein